MCLAVWLYGLSACNGTTNEAITEFINDNGHTFTLSSVRTPKNSVIQTCVYVPLTADEISDANTQMEQLIELMRWQGKVTKLAEPTLSYNCHSYAWHKQSPSPNEKAWINRYRIDPKTGNTTSVLNLDKYWNDGSYKSITTVTDGSIPSGIPNNAKVFYPGGDHSAIKVSGTAFVSKWGLAGLYRHEPMACPDKNNNLIQYFKKNN